MDQIQGYVPTLKRRNRAVQYLAFCGGLTKDWDAALVTATAAEAHDAARRLTKSIYDLPGAVAIGPDGQQALEPGIVNVASLVGRDIDGVKADVRHYIAGELVYNHQRQEGPRIVRLKSAELVKRTGKEIAAGIGNADWLRLSWHTDGLSMPLACGFSATCDKAGAAEWQIRIV